MDCRVRKAFPFPTVENPGAKIAQNKSIPGQHRDALSYLISVPPYTALNTPFVALNRAPRFRHTKRACSKNAFPGPATQTFTRLYNALCMSSSRKGTTYVIEPASRLVLHRRWSPPLRRGSRPCQGNPSRFVRNATRKLSVFSNCAYTWEVLGESTAAHAQPRSTILSERHDRQLWR